MMKLAFAVLLACATTPALADDSDGGMVSPSGKPHLGVLTTLPLAWGEADDLGAIIRGETTQHWLRGALDERYDFVPLDMINAETDQLSALDYLLLAQPRALGAAENVALDEWVRGGGRLLLFADPMMTGETHYAIGDRRRPQDVALLSPILARWGLEMAMDVGQEAVDGKLLGHAMLPVALYGTLALRDAAGSAPSTCELFADAVVAQCEVGRGRVLVVADAAMLDPGMGDFDGVRTALDMLLRRAFHPER